MKTQDKKKLPGRTANDVLVDGINWTPEKVKKFNEYKPDKELTPELADDILKSIQKRVYDVNVLKEATIYHLNQLKAQMGKLKTKASCEIYPLIYISGIENCIRLINNKITKIKSS